MTYRNCLLLATLTAIIFIIRTTNAEIIGQSGSWTISSDYNVVSKVTRFSVGRLDTTRATLLVLTCTNASDSAFTLDSEAFKIFPYGKRISIAGRLPKGEPFDFYGATTGGDRFIILKMTEPASFAWLLAQMIRGDAIGLTIGSNQWAFDLDGFRPAAEKILTTCDRIPSKPR